MNPTVCTHKNNPNFWIFGLFFFLYFFIMATCFPFLPIWLSDVIGLNKTETGLVFSSLSLFAICFQPILGVISDKLGLKKHLMWIVTVLLVLIAPFFLYVFAPLLKTNIWLGALSGGAYIGFAFSAGAGAMEAYIERVSRNSGFEYGKARTFGCLGWALCATTAGMLFSINPEWVFWMGSAAALLLVVLVAIAKPQASQSAQVMDSLGANRPAIDLKTAVRMFRQRKMWMFILYVIGVACVYDVFDQQFATFFKSFFATPEAGTRAFGFATTAGEICNAIIMFSSPWIINRIGAKNTLLIAGMVMAARMIGSSFATTAAEVVALKMLHALEVPFLLVGAFKYITGVFDVRLSATIYLVGFQFSKQVAAILEYVIAFMLAIGIILLCFRMVCSLQYIPNLNTYPNYDDLLEVCFNLIIGVELIRMMYSHSPSTVFEVLLFAIARHIIMDHTSIYSSLIGVCSIAVLFATRKFLFSEFDIADETVFRASTKAKVVNKILSVSIPHEADDTLSNVLLRHLEEQNITPRVGACYYFHDCGLRVAKLHDGKISRIQVIRAIH